MKVLSSLIISLLFSFSVCSAGDLQSDFHLVDASQLLKEGDIVEGVLKVWPIENVDVNEFKKLQNQVLFNTFYVSDIISVNPSENNADVIEIKASFIVQENKQVTPQSFTYKGNEFLVAAPSVKVEKADANEDYFVLEQSVSYSNTTLIIFGALLVFIIVIAIIKKDKISAFISRLRNDPKARIIKKYKDLFLRAKTREDFEKIYAERHEWYSYIEVKAPAFIDYFKLMEAHQYKKTWGTNELTEVQTSFDFIRGSFN